MAKARVTLWFHGEDAFGPLLDSTRDAARDVTVTGAAPFPAPTGRSLPSLSRLVNRLGVPVLLSLSNERLLRAFSHPQEKKALSDGASRRRMLPVVTAALGAELRMFAPFETADELRLNTDLWKQALITPPFAIVPKDARRTVVYAAEPAEELANYRPKGGVPELLCIDLASIERGADPDGAMQRLGERLKDFALASPAAERPGSIDAYLRDVLVAGARTPRFAPDKNDGYDVGREGFPLDLLHALLPESVATRTLAPHGVAILEAGFDVAALPGPVSRGLMLRAIARGAGVDGICPVARARASYLLATALLANVDSDPEAISAIKPDAAATKLDAIATHAGDALRRLGDDVAAKAEAIDTHRPTDTSDAAAFLTSLRAMAAAGLTLLDEVSAAEKDPCVA